MDAADVNQLVAVLEVDCNEAVLACTVVLRHCCLLDHTLLGSKHQVVVFWEVAGSDNCLDLLAFCKRLNNVDDCATLSGSVANRKLVDLEAVHLTKVGKEQHVIMGGSNKEVLDKIVLFERDALNTLAATLLRAINLNRNALYVASVSDGDNHILFSDKILNVQVLNVLVGDLRTTLVSVTVGNLTELISNNSQNLFLVSEKILVVGNIKSELGNLVNKVLTCQTGEAAQTHLKDCLALDFIQTKALVHALLCLSIILRTADDVDNLVDVINCGQKAFQNVDTLLCLVQVKLSTTAYNINLVINVMTQNLTKRKGSWYAINQRQVNDAKVGLELSLLVQVIQNNLWNSISFEVQNDAHTLTVGLIAHVRDAFDFLLVDCLSNLLLEKTLVDLVRNLGNNKALATTLDLLNVNLCTDRNRTAASLVGVLDTLSTHDDAACWEIRTR